MPMMVSLNDFRLASTSGHVVVFKAGKPTFVHPAAVNEAQYRGAKIVDGEPQAAEDADARLRTGFSLELRKSLLALLMQRTAKENRPADFDAGGVPKIETLSKALGFDVDPKERTEVWRAVGSASAGNAPLEIHADAKAVLDILDAESKADLLLLANERGIPAEDVKGMASRDLRKKLLAGYAGLAA